MAIQSVEPKFKKLFAPHFKKVMKLIILGFDVYLMKVRSALDPGMVEICWTSHEWKEFTDKCLIDVEIFHDLIHRANYIYDNRVEKLLENISRIEV